MPKRFRHTVLSDTGSIPPDKTRIGADPQILVSIRQQACDSPVAKTARNGRFVTFTKRKKPCIARCQPDRAVVGFLYRYYREIQLPRLETALGESPALELKCAICQGRKQHLTVVAADHCGDGVINGG